MPQFFFHYHSPQGVTRDEIGCDFQTLEHAYVDAYRSAVDLGAEMLKAHKNPASHRIEIANTQGEMLMELRFDEIFRRERVSWSYTSQALVFRERLQKFYMLRDEMNTMCIVARANVEKAHEVLRRARAIV